MQKRNFSGTRHVLGGITRLLTLIAVGIFLTGSSVSQTVKEKPKFKAIWEPVNYPQDAELHDVYFVSPEVGWVVGMVRSDAGEGGVILHTADGGQHWDVQLGDPHSAARGFEELFFLDAKHGWATREFHSVACPTAQTCYAATMGYCLQT